MGVLDREAFGHSCLLGHTRLSIIDLSDHSNQPLQLDEHRWLVYNGEIYNYKELSLRYFGRVFESDALVFASLYRNFGASCLQMLRGMFSAAILDIKSGSLWLHRDQFGIKPLYWACDPKGFTFSSELSGLLTIRDSLAEDTASALRYLLLTEPSPGSTFYEGYSELLPGWTLKFSLRDGSVNLTKWYFGDEVDPPEFRTYNEAAAAVRECFLDSVRLHLNSDVDVAFALSGGIDSSSIVSVARYLFPYRPITTFSFIPGQSNMDESNWIDLVVNDKGLKNVKVRVDQAEICADLPPYLDIVNQPLTGVSFLYEYSLYRSVSASGYKVCIDGHGADELFAGYDGYPTEMCGDALQRKRFDRFFRLIMGQIKRGGLDSGLRAAIASLVSSRSFHISLLPQTAKYLNTDHRFTLGRLKIDWVKNLQINDTLTSPLRNRLDNDIFSGSCPRQLRGADLNSMLSSVENRVPFLNEDLYQISRGMSAEWLFPLEGRTKSILRDALTGIVPKEILFRTDKVGYSAPKSIPSRFGKHFWERVSEGVSKSPLIGDKEGLIKLFAHIRRSASVPANGPVWRMMNYCYWRGQY
jgi:asparagine synthase (glutamine-hydrolysing)